MRVIAETTLGSSLHRNLPSRREFLKLTACALLLSLIRRSNPAKLPSFTLPKDVSFPEPNPDANLQPSFNVFLPGGTAGGEYITPIRDYLHTNFGDQVFVPSSISHYASLKKGESLETHYENLGHEIGLRAKDKNIHIIAHSLGGLESLDILKNLLKETSWSGKEIKITFMAGFGFVSEDITGIIETADRLYQIVTNVTVAEQHTAYPLPEKYYEVNPPKSPTSDKAVTIFTDTPEQRAERRSWFETQLTILTPEIKDKILKKLSEIDITLVKAMDTEDSRLFGEIMSQRAEILAPFIQSLFKGENIPKDLHNKYLNLYKETTDNLAPGIQYYLSLLMYLNRVIDYVKGGVNTVLKEIIETAKVRKVDIKIEFAQLERDYLFQSSDVDRIKKDMDSKGIASTLSGFYFLQQLAHSSIGYWPEALGKVFEN
jgi:hypothetical protein